MHIFLMFFLGFFLHFNHQLLLFCQEGNQVFVYGCERKTKSLTFSVLRTKVKHFVWSVTHEDLCVIKCFCSILKTLLCAIMASKVIPKCPTYI